MEGRKKKKKGKVSTANASRSIPEAQKDNPACAVHLYVFPLPSSTVFLSKVYLKVIEEFVFS